MKFIAHRGYSSRFPENSLEAFDAVIKHPCNGLSLTGIELDIHLTADNIIPVMHEIEVLSEEGTMIPVAQCSFEKLQYLHYEQYNGTRPQIPDIDAVLSLVNHQTELCFEIKAGMYDLGLFTTTFTEALRRYQPKRDVIISSFSVDILDFVRPHLANLDIQYGFIFKQPDALISLSRGVLGTLDFLHPWYKLLFQNSELFSVDSLPIRCWAVNDRQTIESLIDLSDTLPIDAIMTDDITFAENFAGT